MQFPRFLKHFTFAAGLWLAPWAGANANENIVYFGVGASDKGDQLKSDQTPITFGFLKLSDTSAGVWGLDIGREGTMLDSTYRLNRAVKQSTSFNLLVGRNLTKSTDWRFDAALILGMREKTSDCPDSFLGFQCYANSEPDTKYGVNYGGLFAVTYKNILLGLRATGESTQGVFGLRF